MPLVKGLEGLEQAIFQKVPDIALKGVVWSIPEISRSSPKTTVHVGYKNWVLDESKPINSFKIIVTPSPSQSPRPVRRHPVTPGPIDNNCLIAPPMFKVEIHQ
ncbi:hypothetical protein J6590_040449 [Homalodisca vitripennis]|nr:hypothetical protein J6590_040449 [Homalodisca vitripennis]